MHPLLSAAAGIVFLSAPVLAATQVIAGKRLMVQDPTGTEDRRKVILDGREAPAAATVVGDPSAGGATLRLVTSGLTLSDVTYTLAAAGWRPIPGGFVYSGPTTGDPVKKVTVRKSAAGVFRLRVVASGRIGSLPLDVVQPDAATDGGVILTITGGDTYCVSFGGAAGGTLSTSADRFRITNPTAEAGCPVFGPPQPVAILGYAGDAMEPFIIKDGRFLLFNNSNQPPTDTNLQFAERIDDLTFDYRGELSGPNSTALDAVSSMDAAGNLYFVSTRSYATTLSTIYRGQFADGVVSGIELVAGVSPQQPGIVNFDVEISADGATMFVVDGDFSGGLLAAADLVIAAREGATFRRLPEGGAPLLVNVNTDALEYAAALSANTLELFLTRFDPAAVGTVPAIYRAVRGGLDQPFGPPQPIVAMDGFVEAPTLSSDGRSLYYHKLEGDQFVIHRLAR